MLGYLIKKQKERERENKEHRGHRQNKIVDDASPIQVTGNLAFKYSSQIPGQV